MGDGISVVAGRAVDALVAGRWMSGGSLGELREERLDLPEQPSYSLGRCSAAMDEDKVAVERQDLHHLASLGPSDRLACLLSLLVLDDHCVAIDERVRLLGASQEPLFHLGVTLGMSLLVKASIPSGDGACGPQLGGTP